MKWNLTKDRSTCNCVVIDECAISAYIDEIYDLMSMEYLDPSAKRIAAVVKRMICKDVCTAPVEMECVIGPG